MDLPRLEDMGSSVSSLSDRESAQLFACWWRRWQPVLSLVFSNVPALNVTLTALELLQPPWSALRDDGVVAHKMAVGELSRFVRSPDVESSSVAWSALTRIGWSAAPLVRELLLSRRDADCGRALAHVVRESPGLIASIALADRTPPVDMTVSELLAMVEQFEVPEVRWFAASIRAILRREDLSSLQAVSVAVEPVVVRLAARLDRGHR